MIQIVQVMDDKYNDQIGELLVEYFNWANGRLFEDFGISLDIETIIDQDMQEIDIYFPPTGSLFLATMTGSYVGMIFLTELRPRTGEIRRMYVRPQYRRKRIGRELLKATLEEGRRLGYSTVLLESPQSFKEAHALYKSSGFINTAEYPESEVPAAFRDNWIFMEMQL